ncbi:MAG: hypothetical protein PHO37_09840 [Kiritimatiellae bacterium]|nr:hypothetical protein [Kiritimatiellia bacterium]
MRELLKKVVTRGMFASLLMAAAVLHSAVFYEDFQAYDVENPSDFSTNSVPTGNWIPSSTAVNATRIFDTTFNYGGSRLWISNVDGSSITSAGITVESNTQYRLSVCLVLETQIQDAAGVGAYDVLLGTEAATAVSLVNGAVEVAVRGDGNNSYNDQITTALFNVGDVAPGEKLFLRFTRLSGGGSWFGVDNVTLNKTRQSAQLKYSYDLDQYPHTHDLDGNGTWDFFSSNYIPINGKGFGVMTNANQDNVMYRTDFMNSIWRTQFLNVDGFTIDFAVNITTNADEGTSGTIAHWTKRSTKNEGIQWFIKRQGFLPTYIGSGENNLGWHTYRIACSPHGFQMWRDGVPLNGKLTALNVNTGTANQDLTWFGDWGGAIGGSYTIDYYRLDPTGAYAPTPDIDAGTRMQWGADYTSGNVADQNGGVVEDDSVWNNHGKKHWNNPAYSADKPKATLLRDCTGVGSFNFATGHTSVQSVNNNFIALDEVLEVGGLTMEVWAKQSATAGGSAMIMTMQDAFSLASPNGKYKVAINSFEKPGPEFEISESAKVAAGWTHLAAIIKNVTRSTTNYSGTVELWVNGELKDSVTEVDMPQLGLVRPVELGAAHTSSSGIYRWDGYLYEPRITLGVLDPKEFTYVKIWGTVLLVQ